VHYEDAWLLAELAHITATSPAAPRSPAAWLQDELQADRERWPGLKQPEGADCETAPPGGRRPESSATAAKPRMHPLPLRLPLREVLLDIKRLPFYLSHPSGTEYSMNHKTVFFMLTS
jgi:hypothetical protein